MFKNIINFDSITFLLDSITFLLDSITFLLDRDLFAQHGHIKVDFQKEYDLCPCSGHGGGFNISSTLFAQSCGWPNCWKACDHICCQKLEMSDAP